MAAARTKRLRIGTAVSLAPFYNPLRLAEEVALSFATRKFGRPLRWLVTCGKASLFVYVGSAPAIPLLRAKKSP